MTTSKRRAGRKSCTGATIIKPGEPAGSAARIPVSAGPSLELERSGGHFKFRATGWVAYLVSLPVIVGGISYVVHHVV